MSSLLEMLFSFHSRFFNKWLNSLTRIFFSRGNSRKCQDFRNNSSRGGILTRGEVVIGGWKYSVESTIQCVSQTPVSCADRLRCFMQATFDYCHWYCDLGPVRLSGKLQLKYGYIFCLSFCSLACTNITAIVLWCWSDCAHDNMDCQLWNGTL